MARSRFLLSSRIGRSGGKDAGRRDRGFGRPGSGDDRQGALEVADEKREGGDESGPPPNHHHIGIAPAMINRGMAERLSQPPPDAVALGRMADLLRDRQAEAQSARVVAHESLHGHPFSMKAAARSPRQGPRTFGPAVRSSPFAAS